MANENAGDAVTNRSASGHPRRQGRKTTVLRSAAPIRIDCDHRRRAGKGNRWLTMPGEQHWPELLWRLLAVLSEERRWLVWVAPPQWPTAADLAACNIDLRHVLCVHLKPGVDPLPFAERALASGKCSAVLTWPPTVTADQLARIQNASRQGNALGLLNPPLGLESKPERTVLAVPRQISLDL